MFQGLTTAERQELSNRLWRAGARLDREYLALSQASNQTLAAYHIGGRFGALASDWLMAAVDCYRTAREIDTLPPADDRCTICHRRAHRPGAIVSYHGHAYAAPGATS
jgi:hypothetical protein